MVTTRVMVSSELQALKSVVTLWYAASLDDQFTADWFTVEVSGKSKYKGSMNGSSPW